MQELTPVLLPDEGEAGSVWRAERLRELEWRARCLELHADPEVEALAAQIREHTAALEELWQAQQKGGYERKWWQDGEYDAAKADEANDCGSERFAAGDLAQAIEFFTEAIRLCPTSAVYHCNRAAVALKLGNAELAAEDADNALARDETYCKAHLRAGRARLRLQQAQQAELHFQHALELEPGNAAAQRGLTEVRQLGQRQRAQQEQEQRQADSGARPALGREAAAAEQAALQLLSADSMLSANPSLEAAKCARVEAMIGCTRYGDALALCAELLDSTERLYLEAEALWRQGDVAAAVDKLHAAVERAPGVAKCLDLVAFLQPLRVQLERAAAAMEDGVYSEAWEACTEGLAAIDPGACTGLACALLRHRADAAAGRRMWKDALLDLDAALQLEPANAACLQQRAHVHKQAGAYTEHFLDLQRLKRAAPGTPGLSELIEEAARLCLGADGQSAGVSARAAAGPALQALGLTAGASAAEVRRSYLRLAGEWHPDKWGAASGEEQAKAEERFKAIQAAYEELTA